MTEQKRTLLIDLGNSNLKWAWLEDGRLGPVEKVSHSSTGGEPDLALERWQAGGRPDRVLISAVAAPERVEQIRDWTVRQWGLEPELLKAEARALGVTSGYDNPGQLGVDRWMALLAAHHSVPGPVCIVDCGTAVTVDVLGRDGRHLGGLILPGIGMMRQALRRDTAIPWVEGGSSSELLTTETGSAIAAGGLNAVAALVEKVLEHATGQLGESPVLLLTGGDADLLQGVLKEPGISEPDLVMKGMALIADTR